MILALKKHAPYIASSVFLSFSAAFCLTGIIAIIFTPSANPHRNFGRSSAPKSDIKRVADYQFILNSSFFQLSNSSAGSSTSVPDSISNMSLIGTISGPSSIARAMIKKNSDNVINIFKIGEDVFGMKLVRVENKKVYLKSGDKTQMLEMFPPKQEGGAPAGSNLASGTNIQKQTISRTDLMNKIQNNLDTMLQGLRAAPYREDGTITGFKIIGLAQNSPLYELGIRSGDIIKRINGHPIDGTDKLYKYWKELPNESRFVIDVQRTGGIISLDYTISN